MLDVLGLEPFEEGVYRRLVRRTSDTADGLAAGMQADPSRIHDVLRSLQDKGLVAPSATAAGHFTASPPELALGSLLVQRQDAIRKAQLEVSRLTEQYRSATPERAETDVVDVVRGGQAVAQRFAQLQRGATSEVLALVKADVAMVAVEDNIDEEAAVHRGVTYRVVLERAAFERPGFVDRVVESVNAGEHARVVAQVPLRLVIADRALALVPLAPRDSNAPAALLVHPSGLLDALTTLFELVWAQANEIVPTAQGISELAAHRIDEIDARILTLLLAGLTDQAIGSQLGLSLRTVQRRVSNLMEQAGVVTRFQLGHVAGRRGWVGA
ncbi:hypothetical protein CS0771_47290 [Catellatospora sp. IY07-71]|uniref:helix-turn-helix transcriptional regulator n=1 Tax=Catellatospora sp. IY07-71 TaxID=2728827 RepID=UPI001BB397F0|nr:LuxR family transcriptional regulator [Catellatospora sp. IY07-71]BCJ75185.1 hypothetical protein CS0771_47290 [Catellatospora sp. IY07-71]